MTNYHTLTLEQWWANQQKADSVEWTRISAETGEWLRGMTQDDGLLVEIEPGNSLGHPAIYRRDRSTVEINPDICVPGVAPETISMKNESGRLRNPALTGAACHEGSHGEFSLWEISQDPKKRRVVQAALLLEESACEKDCIANHASSRVYLRASFGHIAVDGVASIGGVSHAAELAALVHARVDAGVLTFDEMQPIIEELRKVIGDRYDDLREVWLDVQALGVRNDAAIMESHGQRWLDILGDDADKDSDGESDGLIRCGAKMNPSDSGDGQADGLMKTLQELAAAVSEDASRQAEDSRGGSIAREMAAKMTSDANKRKREEEAAREVFENRGGHDSRGSSNEGLLGEREPTKLELQQVNLLARRIERAQFRDRTLTSVRSQLPPGRLHSSSAVRRSAERSMGMMSTAEPWRQVVRKQTEDPLINVAIACDISGSMSSVVKSVASAAWVIARAVHRNEGQTMTIAYGKRVHPVVRPGETPKKVREFNANGGWENFTEALDVMNGSVLAGTTGIRLAVFVSDGHYNKVGQWRTGSEKVQEMLRRGVKILWVGLDGESYDKVPAGCTYVHLRNTSDIGQIVGRAMVELLENA